MIGPIPHLTIKRRRRVFRSVLVVLTSQTLSTNVHATIQDCNMRDILIRMSVKTLQGLFLLETFISGVSVRGRGVSWPVICLAIQTR